MLSVTGLCLQARTSPVFPVEEAQEIFGSGGKDIITKNRGSTTETGSYRYMDRKNSFSLPKFKFETIFELLLFIYFNILLMNEAI